MDLHSMLNDGPPAGAPLSRQSTALTPLQTSPQASAAPQYHFTNRQSQSPATVPAPGHQHAQYGPYSATTPGARPPSHGYPYPQPSPSQYQAHGLPPTFQQAASFSPTPSSHHSQTPHSVRQSPLPTMSHGPPPQHPQYQYQHSQPSTPLGPPPPHYPRTSHGYQEMQSPYHQRNSSGASSGMIAASPAQHHPSIGNLLDSPSAYTRQSPHLRRTSDYLGRVNERERSMSVSPKTKILPRALSQSSQPESYPASARSSLQHQHGVASAAEAPSHVQNSHSGVAHIQSLDAAHSSVSDVAQQAQIPYPASDYPVPEPRSLSQGVANNQPPPHQAPIQHLPQKMGMNHLLAPANTVPDTQMNGAADGLAPKQRKQQGSPGIFMKPSPKPKKPAVASLPPTQPLQQASEDRSGAADTIAVEQKGQQQPHVAPGGDAEVREPSVPVIPDSVGPSQKRPAESEPSTEPPAKRGRTQKYTQKPIWARLRRDNPRYRAEVDDAVNGAVSKLPAHSNGVPSLPPQQQPHPHVNGNMQQQQPNGIQDEKRPWLEAPPIDHDLDNARKVMGAWEKSIRYSVPMPEMLKQLMDWFYTQLAGLQDIGRVAERQGTIEIEAKIGRLLQQDSEQRLWLPITTPAIVQQPFVEKNLRFESQMGGHEHESMNQFLNATLKQTHDMKGRVPMDYAHPKEIDSFRPLSAAGLDALPPAFRRHRPGKRDTNLRTTTDQLTGKLIARIVKFKVADLHIYNPAGDYDCRISINLEAKLDGIEPWQDLVDDWRPDQQIAPDRKKDRVSYKHLNVYSIDLTKVEVPGVVPKHELELEMDADQLREQMWRQQRGEENAFTDLVAGFLDNATWLMKQRASGGQQ